SAAMTRLRLLLVSAWLSVTVSTGMDVQKRIVGGNECERHYHVHLRIVFADGTSSFCGGTLISDQWIVTAAHYLFPSSSSSSLEPALTPKLHCADFKLVDCKSLIQRLKADIPERYSRRSHQHWFCAKTDLGDSGGGAVFEDKIYGVVSFTGDPKYVCREDIGIMDLCNQDYRKWIDDTIKT
uniref:Peptidase S1 domain-containing protein n=1 Tax=Scophthalmus maximus TaxID=52904 RepID=A0A8D3DID8_SCOMX